MLTIIFLGMLALFAFAGIFISMEAKQSAKGVRAAVPADGGTKLAGRATPEND